MTDADFYPDMHRHPELVGFFRSLELVEPGDDFNNALDLVCRCLDARERVREQARQELREVMTRQRDLVMAYRSAVVLADRRSGSPAADFGQALLSLPDDVAAKLKDGLAQQMRALRCS